MRKRRDSPNKVSDRAYDRLRAVKETGFQMDTVTVLTFYDIS